MVKDIISRKRALEIIDRFHRSKVLVVGDIMVDQFIWGKVSRISPEAPVPVVKVTSENLLLGGCTNVLNNVFSMGGQVAVSGIVGSDTKGRWLIDTLKKMNIDTAGVIVEEKRPTIVKTRVIAHNQQVVRFDREDKGPVTQESLQKIIAYIQAIKDDLGAVIISDYNKGVFSEQLVREIREITSRQGIILCIDPKQNDFSLYRGCDLITPNHQETERALGREIENRDDLITGGSSLLRDFDFRALLVTMGEEGMTLFERDGGLTHIPAVAREVFDVTGAGDTVIGVFALCVAAGATFTEAAVLANHAAGIAVGKVGTAPVYRDELKKAL
ncbi:MAG: D-glycero-beta-D-manno-heptose-7-phosphate kinase [Deltaproteobacteria bacterium]|nr:D-glycero-beta-D-manno-heptose-7-phosphate kinase [Deltaproteobacteria bacterium]MBW2675531.1 D-glycero-beta-D-manno-heptose-7-phosphate kinase [Deltaproteobacteria bacterium]